MRGHQTFHKKHKFFLVRMFMTLTWWESPSSRPWPLFH